MLFYHIRNNKIFDLTNKMGLTDKRTQIISNFFSKTYFFCRIWNIGRLMSFIWNNVASKNIISKENSSLGITKWKKKKNWKCFVQDVLADSKRYFGTYLKNPIHQLVHGYKLYKWIGFFWKLISLKHVLMYPKFTFRL